MAKIAATKLENADVRFISLVKRGANRIPFRIIKQEKDMSIDLNSIWRAKKSEAPTPFVSAVVIQKGEHEAALTDAIQAAGFTVEYKMEDTDGTIAFKQFDAPLGDYAVYKMDENVLLLFADMRDQVLKADGDNAFVAAVQANDALPSLSEATGLMNDLITKADADVPAIAAAYGAYVKLIKSALPDEAAVLAEKADAIAKAAKAKPTPTDPDGDGDDDTTDDPTENPDAADDAAMGDAEKQKAKKAQHSPADPAPAPRSAGSTGPSVLDGSTNDAAAKKRGQKNQPGTNVDEQENLDSALAEQSVAGNNDASNNVVASNVKNPLQKNEADGSGLADLIKAMKSELMAEIGGLKSQVTGMEGRLDSVEAVAKSAEKAVKGTVTVGSEQTDRSFGVRAQKSEQSGGVFADLQLFPGLE